MARTAHKYDAAQVLRERFGIATDDCRYLVRISRQLSTWDEHECNGTIQRDETTGVCRWYNSNTGRMGSVTSDREKGAHRRLAALLARYPGLLSYRQGDPRGASLYVYRQTDLDGYNARRNGEPCDIDACYSSVGVAVC